MVWLLPTRCLTVCMAALLVACATRVAHVDPAPADSTRVDHALLLQAGQPQYQMDDLSLFVMPSELEAPSPAFPSGVAPGDLAALAVCVEVWLDDAGEVSRLFPARGGEGCPKQVDAQAGAFEQAVVQAMRGWRFSAAAICRFPEHLRAQRERGDCRGKEIELTHVPVRLTYAFTFQRKAGLAQIAATRLPAMRTEPQGRPQR